MKNLTKKTKALCALLVAFSFTACIDQNESGVAQVGLQTKSYVAQNNNIYEWLLLPKAHAAVSNVSMCFKRLRFKKDLQDTLDPVNAEDNVDFNIGEVNLATSGTSLGAVSIPTGPYVRIEFDLEDSCAGGNSLDLSNDNGSYASQDRITIKCEGNFTISSNSVVSLDMQPIINQLDTYNGIGSLKDLAESVNCNVDAIL